MFVEKQAFENLTFEYIRGLIEGEGCFTLCKNKNGKRIIPSFSLGMAQQDEALVEMISKKLKLRRL